MYLPWKFQANRARTFWVMQFFMKYSLLGAGYTTFFKLVWCNSCCVPHNNFFKTESFATKISTNVLYNCRYQPWTCEANRQRTFWAMWFFIKRPQLGAGYAIFVQTSKVESLVAYQADTFLCLVVSNENSHDCSPYLQTYQPWKFQASRARTFWVTKFHMEQSA